MSEAVFNVDRAVSQPKNVDAQGKQWVIHVNRANGLCYVRPNPDRENAVIPKEVQGLWTKPSLAQAQLTKYLNASWDHAEAAKLKSERQTQASQEYKARKKKELEESDDSGSESN